MGLLKADHRKALKVLPCSGTLLGTSVKETQGFFANGGGEIEGSVNDTIPALYYSWNCTRRRALRVIACSNELYALRLLL